MALILPLIAGLSCAAVLASCGQDSSEGEQPAAGEPSAAGTRYAPAEQPQAADQPGAAARPKGPLVKLRGSQFGPVLFSGADRAIYTFTRDGEGGGQARSRCRGDCAVAWPPFLAKGPPRAARGVKRSLLSTIPRGRRRQVTYRGQPLYFYEHDPKGEVLCNDIVEFGGTWFAVTAEGRPPA